MQVEHAVEEVQFLLVLGQARHMLFDRVTPTGH